MGDRNVTFTFYGSNAGSVISGVTGKKINIQYISVSASNAGYLSLASGSVRTFLSAKGSSQMNFKPEGLLLKSNGHALNVTTNTCGKLAIFGIYHTMP